VAFVIFLLKIKKILKNY